EAADTAGVPEARTTPTPAASLDRDTNSELLSPATGADDSSDSGVQPVEPTAAPSTAFTAYTDRPGGFVKAKPGFDCVPRNVEFVEEFFAESGVVGVLDGSQLAVG